MFIPVRREGKRKDPSHKPRGYKGKKLLRQMEIKTISEQLSDLRSKWLEYKLKGDTQGMKIIELRAKLLKIKTLPKDTIELATEIFK